MKNMTCGLSATDSVFVIGRNFYPVIARWWVAVALLFGSVGFAAPGIQDHAGLFSSEAKAEVAKVMSDLHKRTGRDLFVETFGEIPSKWGGGVDLKDRAAAHSMYERWAGNQARDGRVNGVYVLIVKQPGHLHSVVGNETLKNAFSMADRDELIKTMMTRLKEKNFDGALRDGASFVSRTISRNLKASPASVRKIPSWRSESVASGIPGWALVLMGLFGVVLVIRLIGSLFSGGGGGYAGGMGGGYPVGGGYPMGGGGGFFRSMMGGLFGAAAGMWMYDRFFGDHASASGFDSHNAGTSGSQDADGQDTSYSGGGEDFDAGQSSDSSDSGSFWGGSDSSDSDSSSGGGDSGGGEISAEATLGVAGILGETSQKWLIVCRSLATRRGEICYEA